MAITRSASDTKKREQNVLNDTYDEDFNVVAVEMLGHDTTNNVLRRVAVTATGALKVAV